MVFEQIDRLKRDYTDKYVVVDGNRPELSRFRGMTGVVKTVNMNGRALVQFDANANIGWFDIGLDFLQVVDAPLPKVTEAKEKPAAPKKAAPEAKLASGAAAKSAEPGKRSTADILAAARAKQGEATKPATAAAKPGAKPSTADILAAARAKTGGTPSAAAPKAAEKPALAKVGKPSTADKLAAARGKAAPPPAEAPAASVETPVKTAEKPKPKPAPAAAVEASKPAPVAKSKPAGDLPKTTAEIIAYCRRVDAHG